MSFIENLIPDTSTTFAPNTSSVAFRPNMDGADTVFVEDYRQHTFLSGLGSVGGIYTILDGIFAMVFGMGLMAVCSGMSSVYRLAE